MPTAAACRPPRRRRGIATPCASRAYRGTRNLRAVQQLLGHARIGTTERYTAVDDSEIRAAMVAAGGRLLLPVRAAQPGLRINGWGEADHFQPLWVLFGGST
jgi:hypothetical protein